VSNLPFAFLLLLPGSQHFADVGEIELAYNRIHQPAGELSWSQQIQLLSEE